MLCCRDTDVVRPNTLGSMSPRRRRNPTPVQGCGTLPAGGVEWVASVQSEENAVS